VDRKKINTSQVKKAGRITSSTSTTNIAKKLQVKNSLIWINFNNFAYFNTL